MGDKIVYPNGEVIDLVNARNLDILYPDNKIHNIIALYAHETEDGKCILEYLEYNGDILKKKFTELNFIDGEWSKHPFSFEYDKYKFKDFDRAYSDSVIEQLPDQLHFRIDVKKYLNDAASEDEISVGAQVIQPHDEKNIYMVLFANKDNSFVDKTDYNYDFPFATFSYLGDTDHERNINLSRDDINYDAKYREEMYLREEIPMSVRRTVAEFLREDTLDVFDIRDLPILDVTIDDKDVNICFVSCSDVTLYNEIYKADKLFVDADAVTTDYYDNRLESSLHWEIPLSMVLLDGDLQNNGVRHSKEVKK